MIEKHGQVYKMLWKNERIYLSLLVFLLLLILLLFLSLFRGFGLIICHFIITNYNILENRNRNTMQITKGLLPCLKTQTTRSIIYSYSNSPRLITADLTLIGQTAVYMKLRLIMELWRWRYIVHTFGSSKESTCLIVLPELDVTPDNKSRNNNINMATCNKRNFVCIYIECELLNYTNINNLRIIGQNQDPNSQICKSRNDNPIS